MREAKAASICEVSGAIRDAALAGNVTAGIFYLCNKDPEHWRQKNTTELAGPGGAALVFQIVPAPEKKP